MVVKVVKSWTIVWIVISGNFSFNSAEAFHIFTSSFAIMQIEKPSAANYEQISKPTPSEPPVTRAKVPFLSS